MNVNSYTLSADSRLMPCEYQFAIDAIGQKNLRIWIDLESADENDLVQKLDDLKVEGMIRHFCLESCDHPGFYPLKPVSLLVIPVHTEAQDSNSREYLALLYSPDFLFSFQKRQFARFQELIALQNSASLLMDSSIEMLVSSLMLGMSLVSLRKSSFLSDRVMNLENKMDIDHEKLMTEISVIQSEILSLELVVNGQLPIVSAFSTKDTDSINHEITKEYLNWASSNLQSAGRALEWMERRIYIIRSIFDAHAQDRMNRRLARLTILSTIFMPITFLAGLWGMNFQFMPELAIRYGYAIALVTMLIISLGMYHYFRRKGWFN